MSISSLNPFLEMFNGSSYGDWDGDNADLDSEVDEEETASVHVAKYARRDRRVEAGKRHAKIRKEGRNA